MIDQRALDDAVAVLADPAARTMLLAAVHGYAAAARLGATAPRLAEVDRDITGLGDEARRLAGRLRRLGAFNAVLLDPSAPLLAADPEAATAAADAGDLGDLAVRLGALAHLAHRAVARVDEVADVRRGGARDAAILLHGGRPARWALIEAAATAWSADGRAVNGGTAFLGFAAAVGAAAGAPERGLDDVARRVARAWRQRQNLPQHGDVPPCLQAADPGTIGVSATAG